MPELTEKQKELRIVRYRKIIKYRQIFGWIFSLVGAALFIVGVDNGNATLVMINGFCFLPMASLWFGRQRTNLRN
jgi:uncharacterized membrane protein YiaA